MARAVDRLHCRNIGQVKNLGAKASVRFKREFVITGFVIAREHCMQVASFLPRISSALSWLFQTTELNETAFLRHTKLDGYFQHMGTKLPKVDVLVLHLAIGDALAKCKRRS